MYPVPVDDYAPGGGDQETPPAPSCSDGNRVVWPICPARFRTLVKLGNLVHFEFGPAVIAFVLCVTMSLLASMSFDPHSIWSENE